MKKYRKCYKEDKIKNKSIALSLIIVIPICVLLSCNFGLKLNKQFHSDEDRAEINILSDLIVKNYNLNDETSIKQSFPNYNIKVIKYKDFYKIRFFRNGGIFNAIYNPSNNSITIKEGYEQFILVELLSILIGVIIVYFYFRFKQKSRS